MIFKICILLTKIEMNTNKQKEQKKIKGHLRSYFWGRATLGFWGRVWGAQGGTWERLLHLHIFSHTAQMLQGSFFAWRNPNSSLGQGQCFGCFLFFLPQHKPSTVPGIYWGLDCSFSDLENGGWWHFRPFSSSHRGELGPHDTAT